MASGHAGGIKILAPRASTRHCPAWAQTLATIWRTAEYAVAFGLAILSGYGIVCGR